jgi:ketosteroid isomerase-like protein
MSANLDLVRSIYADWERGDFSRSEWAHPEIEFMFADGPDPGRWVGLGVMAQRWREQLGPWEELTVAAEEYRELDDERVLVLYRAMGRGSRSGLEVLTEGANVFHVRDGEVARLVLYWDRERAVAELGLAQDDSPGAVTLSRCSIPFRGQQNG